LTLQGGVNFKTGVMFFTHLARGLDGEALAIALSAQMKLNEVPEPSWCGMAQDTAQEVSRLSIGKMAVVSQDSSNQLWRSP
jgi:hypothetical protein